MHKQVQNLDTVQRLSRDLLLLLARFADEEGEASVIRLFRETVNSIHGSELMGEFQAHPDGAGVPVQVEAYALITGGAFYVVSRALRESAADHVAD